MSRTGGRNYAESVARGFYSRPSQGLTGKYDNVRVYWEDYVTRSALAPAIGTLTREAEAAGRGVRVLDLGCGAGEGLELIGRIHHPGPSLGDTLEVVLPYGRIEVYHGVDLSPSMVEQGRANWADLPQARFSLGDLREGLGGAAADGPYDLAFSSYGSLSHLLAPEALLACLARAAAVLRPGGFLVLDLLGRLSPEWPGAAEAGADPVRTYSMSYIYPPGERSRVDIDRFPCRFWTGEEVREVARELAGRLGKPVEVVSLIDRSILVGRHVDTREFGCTLPPLRGLACRLLEHHIRTRLGELRIPAEARPQPGPAASFLAGMIEAWNQLVGFTEVRLAGERPGLVAMPGWSEFPPTLQHALMTMDRIVDSVAWIEVGDVRANVIEPQLAFVLRRLERSLQQGMGCGHGLHAVLRLAP